MIARNRRPRKRRVRDHYVRRPAPMNRPAESHPDLAATAPRARRIPGAVRRAVRRPPMKPAKDRTHPGRTNEIAVQWPELIAWIVFAYLVGRDYVFPFDFSGWDQWAIFISWTIGTLGLVSAVCDKLFPED